jgi:hypothetical protein
MSKTAKRMIFGHEKGYLNAVGPQSRFIVFLIFVLMAYTLLLRVFQKLAEILQLPVFLPISLITLLVFIGVIGTVYSHSFVGPMTRIRRTIDQMAGGNDSISLRLRESDDPMLKDLVSSISRLNEHSKNTHILIADAALNLFADIETLEDLIKQGADITDIQKQVGRLREKQYLMEQAVHLVRQA